MEAFEKPKLIIFGKFNSFTGREVTLNLGCWLKGAYIKRVKGLLSDRFYYRQFGRGYSDTIHLLYIFDYRITKDELRLLRFSIIKSIDRNGDFITEHN